MVQEINVAKAQVLTEQKEDACFTKSFHSCSFPPPHLVPSYSHFKVWQNSTQQGTRVHRCHASSLHPLDSSSMAPASCWAGPLLTLSAVKSLCLGILLTSTPRALGQLVAQALLILIIFNAYSLPS